MRLRCVVISLLLCCLPAAAQHVDFQAGARFKTAIINDEAAASGNYFIPSRTLAAARLSPYLSLGFGNLSSLHAALDFTKEFGSGTPCAKELSFWYQLDGAHWDVVAGAFPRELMQGEYSTLILSERKLFFDNIMEGLMVRFHNSRWMVETALDWNGRYGNGVHEQFNVISAGEGHFNSWFGMGWQAMFHHWANSMEVRGVFDDHVLNAFLRFDLGESLGLQCLTLDPGLVLSYHANRIAGDRRAPMGFLLKSELMHWGFGLRNEAYYGPSQAPFWKDYDTGGNPLGENLYFRSGFWQVRSDGTATPGFFDRLELFWEPVNTPLIGIRIGVTTFFASGAYAGIQQAGVLKLNLENIFNRNNENN